MFLHHLAERCVEVLGVAEAGLVLVDARGQLQHWPPRASGCAVPIRLRDERIGALNLFANETSGLVDADQAVAQALADVATIGILHQRFIARREEVTEQLQVAFNTRVVLEQAKGFVAEAKRIDMDAAFALLRGCARHDNPLLSEVARRVIDRELAADALVIPSRTSAIRRG